MEARRNVRSYCVFSFFCLSIATISAVGAADTPSKGLQCGERIYVAGRKPYAGIGANYDTLFGRLLQNKDDPSSLENLARPAKSGIPFVRFRACGFWPRNAQLYLNDKPEYFRRMDQVVKCAETNHIGLIPSLFWHLGTVAELMGEEPSRLGDPDSKSIAYIKQYTTEMVQRYNGSPAIWGWEFGNEANLGVDLPRRSGREAPAEDRSEAPPVRLATAQLRNAYMAFARAVRRIDPWRTIDSGTSIPRPAGWHNAHGRPRQRDSAVQSYSILLEQNPDPIDLLSVHVYARSQKLSPYGPEKVSDFVGRYSRFAAKSGKPLFMGEFPVRDRREASDYINAIVDNRVPLSAFWTFDNPQQENTLSVTFENERSFVIALAAKANESLRQAP